MSHWTYQNKVINNPPEKAFGFVYLITNNVTGQRYIGRKYLEQTRRKPPKKGNVNRRIVRSESNWREYTGSCIPLNADIKNLGKENFKFEIVAFGYTKGQVNFLEEVVQIKKNVLTDTSYYNDAIGAKKFMGLKITDQLLDVIRMIDEA